MKIGKSCRLCFVILWAVILFAGCSSSGDGGGDLFASSDNETYTESGSDLVLEIPDSLVVSQEEIEEIYYYADLVDYCRTTNRETIDIVLAEACVYYDMLYLFPEYFPENLDDILDVSDFVGYLRNWDSFTYYFSTEYFTEVLSYYSGSSAFIGFTVQCSSQTVSDDAPLLVSDIDPYTRAWIDGFEVGDRIVEIDGVSVSGMDLDDVELLFPTGEAETVEITVDRDGAEITILTAAEENIDLVLYDDIAYLNARSFTETTGEEIRLDFEALQTAASGSIDKLILDLRDNGGGLHSGMAMLIDYLIDKDNGSYPFMSSSGPAFEEEEEYLGDYCEYNIGAFDETNFVLLVDAGSASASEIVAAALKYYDTAYLIGETTYGKGIGQSVIELMDGSGVLIPSLNVLPPSGESYHGVGVAPDYYMSDEPTSFEDDPVLDAAVDYLESKCLAGRSIEEKPMDASGGGADPLEEMLRKKNRSGSYF